MSRLRGALVLIALFAPVRLVYAQDPIHDPRIDDLEWRTKKDAQLAALLAPSSRATSATVTNPLTQLSARGLTDSSNNYYVIGEFRNDTNLTLSFSKIFLTLRKVSLS